MIGCGERESEKGLNIILPTGGAGMGLGGGGNELRTGTIGSEAAAG